MKNQKFSCENCLFFAKKGEKMWCSYRRIIKERPLKCKDFTIDKDKERTEDARNHR